MSTSQKQSGVVLQDRDKELLQGFYEARIMTRKHVADIYFEGRVAYTKKRIQQLIRAGYLTERPRKPAEPAILYIGKNGFDALEAEGLLQDYPRQQWVSVRKRVLVSERTIAHELQVMDIKAAMTHALHSAPLLTLAEFSTLPKLYEFRARKPVVAQGITRTKKVLMKPDGFIRVHEQDAEGISEHAFFLEVDRGTESLHELVGKAIGYRDFYKRGGFAERCGYDPRDPSACPFRVLW